MILQQFGGINGIVFYANSIFISAGMCRIFSMLILLLLYDKEKKANARILDL